MNQNTSIRSTKGIDDIEKWFETTNPTGQLNWEYCDLPHKEIKEKLKSDGVVFTNKEYKQFIENWEAESGNSWYFLEEEDE